MLKSAHLVFVTVSTLVLGTAAIAADMQDMKGKNVAMTKPAADQAHGIGVVKAVDLQVGTVTIAHEPIKSFEWPAMTMKFKVVDPAMLKNVATGNKVKFTLQGQDMMKTTVIALERAE
jgi:Cu(I)/Ag(I) efflux system periplasmic protein CusF